MRKDEGFEEFYQGHYRHILALVAVVLGDRHEAEDVTQEAFARALVRWPRLARYDKPEAWVRRVALRLAADVGRRVRRSLRLRRRLETATDRPGGSVTDLAESAALGIALGRVPLRQREILVLHYLVGLPVREIAQEIGLPPGTVKTRLSAGRRRLEREFAGREEAHDEG